MRRALALALASCVWPALAHADPSAMWPAESAWLVPKGRVEFGLSGPLRVPLTGRLELEAHPATVILAPGVWLRPALASGRDWAISSRHGVWYPTFAQHVLARSGVSRGSIGNTLVVENGVRASARPAPLNWVTLEASVSAPLWIERGEDEWIDRAVLYGHFAPVRGASARVSARYEVRTRQGWGAWAATRVRTVAEAGGGFELEQEVALTWDAARWLRLEAGAVAAWSRRPDGSPGFGVYPVLDMVFGLE